MSRYRTFTDSLEPVAITPEAIERATRLFRKLLEDTMTETNTARTPDLHLTNPAPHPNRINVYPLGSRIVVRPEESEARTQTGLVIPDTSQEKPQRGKVLAVGPGREIVDRDGNVTVVRSKIQPGHTVLYSRYAGSIIVVDNPDYDPHAPEYNTPAGKAPKLDLLVLSEADVLGIVLPPGQFDLGAGPESVPGD